MKSSNSKLKVHSNCKIYCLLHNCFLTKIIHNCNLVFCPKMSIYISDLTFFSYTLGQGFFEHNDNNFVKLIFQHKCSFFTKYCSFKKLIQFLINSTFSEYCGSRDIFKMQDASFLASRLYTNPRKNSIKLYLDKYLSFVWILWNHFGTVLCLNIADLNLIGIENLVLKIQLTRGV